MAARTSMIVRHLAHALDALLATSSSTADDVKLTLETHVAEDDDDTHDSIFTDCLGTWHAKAMLLKRSDLCAALELHMIPDFGGALATCIANDDVQGYDYVFTRAYLEYESVSHDVFIRINGALLANALDGRTEVLACFDAEALTGDVVLESEEAMYGPVVWADSTACTYLSDLLRPGGGFDNPTCESTRRMLYDRVISGFTDDNTVLMEWQIGYEELDNDDYFEDCDGDRFELWLQCLKEVGANVKASACRV